MAGLGRAWPGLTGLDPAIQSKRSTYGNHMSLDARLKTGHDPRKVATPLSLGICLPCSFASSLLVTAHGRL
jgi:hypothetical protein